MVSFSSDILLPFPNSNDLNSCVGEEESVYDYIASFQEKIFMYYNVGNNFVSV